MSGASAWRGRKRRTSVYSDRDRRTWIALAAAAQRVAANPDTKKTGAMAHAAHRRLVMMPPGWQGRDSPFLAMRHLGQIWDGLDVATRRTKAPELAALAARCAEILAPKVAEPLPRNDHVREPHRRVDIDD